MADPVTDSFEQHRPMLTAVAYRMLGEIADAEDVVQEAWLRWSAADTAAVREPRAFLVRTTTRLAIDRLRQLRARREAYVGPWLPEPLVTEAGQTSPDTAQGVLLAESVSLALLVVLESLSPAERAVFVLHEAFAYPYPEIARILDRSDAAVRQMASRARAHVEDRHPRFEVARTEREEITRRFMAACAGGDVAGLLKLLAPQVRLVSDGGGKARAARRVVEGAEKVARFLTAVSVPEYLARHFPEPGFHPVDANGAPAVLATSRGVPAAVFVPEVADGRIRTMFLIANPDKLTRIAPPR